VFGISGAMRRQELVQLTVDDVKDVGSALIVKLQDTKNKKERVFTIIDEFYEIYRKYAVLRPITTERRLFLNYQNSKCTKQPVGINKISGIPKVIATYLGLEEPATFTSHCLRRSSSTIFMDAGGSMEDLKRHGGWASTSVAEGYIQESIGHKMQVASKIITAIKHSSENPPQEDCHNQMMRSTSVVTTSSTTAAELPEDFEKSNKKFISFNNCSFSNVTFNVRNERQ
jgi:integrase